MKKYVELQIDYKRKLIGILNNKNISRRTYG